MAEKEYLLGNKARELLKYTNTSTKVVTADIPQRQVRLILEKIATLDDIRDVKMVCEETIGAMEKRDRKGFTKSAYHCYGEVMRVVARQIVADILAANGKMFNTEYDERLRLIGKVLDGCSLMLEYIQVCYDMEYIDMKKMETWTKKVTDVKYMAASWKKNDSARAAKLRAEEAEKRDARSVEVVKTAIRQYNEDRKTSPV